METMMPAPADVIADEWKSHPDKLIVMEAVFALQIAWEAVNTGSRDDFETAISYARAMRDEFWRRQAIRA